MHPQIAHNYRNTIAEFHQGDYKGSLPLWARNARPMLKK